MFKIDREKYLNIARSEGAEKAITTLHLDTQTLENEAFEGRQGYQPQLWSDLHAVRDFSIELWDMAINSERV